jgi:hypothetical protein
MTEFQRGEAHGYELFAALLQSLAKLVRVVYDHEGSYAADEYTCGLLYALEDKMADLEQVIRD